MRRTSLIGVSALVLAGCATTQGYEAILNTWVGDTSDHLVSVWGPPSQQYNLSGGGRVLEYSRSTEIVLPGTTTYQPVTTTSSGTVAARSTSMGSYDSVQTTGTYEGTSTTYVPQTTAPTHIPQNCVTRFTTDGSGRVVSWAWQGNACRAVPPKAPATQPTANPTPHYKKCTADQLRNGECN